ncbi:MAG TPA: type I DNA topoisomerase [Vicinamibacterales bacterium]|nr:type I DNA topoisomerase [Vicinamibacterales bacterium]
MAKGLVIVESPAKAKTINKYLGRNYKVVASMGHVRDLPKSRLGVDLEDGFVPEYEVIASRANVVKQIKDEGKKADEIFVATDPDREGEAIGWHLAEELGKANRKKIRRLLFNEITKKAILEAVKNPIAIDQKMVDAQQARRVIDRLVGYKISPLLWDKVRRGLSAGRVQSVALKLICDREAEIDAFTPEEYWNLIARLAVGRSFSSGVTEFDAKLIKRAGETAKDFRIGNEAESNAVRAALDGAAWSVTSVVTKERRKNAVAPFITSKLQQASRFPVKKTMMLAQQLYEGIELPGEEAAVGLITYMRTDSTRVSEDALAEVREHIVATYGNDYLPEKPNRFKQKSSVQDAHEAIRPTSLAFDPETVRPQLTADQYYLYRLIWNRFVASQMPPATFDETTVDITANDFVFQAKGSVPKFAGWMAVYGGPALQAQPGEGAGPDAADAEDEEGKALLPAMSEGDALDLRELRPEQKFTQPPARYNEGTLVKALEENGIGRPSTYADIIGKLQARDYVMKLEGRFKPTVLGRTLVTKLLSPAFDDILDVEYTAKMEEELDGIEQGKSSYAGVVTDFYDKFAKDLKKAAKLMPNYKEGQPSEEFCEKCGSPMVVKAGKFGLFLACSAYPECENTKELETADAPDAENLEEVCENCGKPMAMKRGRFGPFLACTGYPECKTTRKIIVTRGSVSAAKPDQMLDEKCPQCGMNLVVKQGRFGEFTACSGYPGCKYVKQKSTGLVCPLDGGDVVEKKTRRGKVFFGCANYPKCEFTLWDRPILEPCPKCKAPYLVEKITKKHGRQLICRNEECDYVRSEELTEEPVTA